MCGGGGEGDGEGQDWTVGQEVFLAHGEHPGLPRPVLEGEPRAPDSPGPGQRQGREPSAHCGWRPGRLSRVLRRTRSGWGHWRRQWFRTASGSFPFLHFQRQCGSWFPHLKSGSSRGTQLLERPPLVIPGSFTSPQPGGRNLCPKQSIGSKHECSGTELHPWILAGW